MSVATAVTAVTTAAPSKRASGTFVLPPRKGLAWIKAYAAAIPQETAAKKAKKAVKNDVLLAAGLGGFVKGDVFTVGGKTAFIVGGRDEPMTTTYWAAVQAQYPAIAEAIMADVEAVTTAVFNLAKRD